MTANDLEKVVNGYAARAKLLDDNPNIPEDGEAWLLNELGREVARLAQPLGGDAAALAAEAASAQGVSEVFTGLGGRILRRLERELHQLLCGTTKQDKDDREALGLTGDVLIGTLTTALTMGLSVGPQVAAIAAALIVRRLAAPTIDEACQYWSEAIEKEG